MFHLRKKIAILLFSALVSLSASGCVYLVVGTVGALGGYVISSDTIEGVTNNTKEEVWDAAKDIISIMGLIEEEQKSAGVMIAKVNNAKVTITTIPLSSSAVKLSVKARKSFLPKISIAQDVFVKIMSQVNE
jgi:hypothetical protein